MPVPAGGHGLWLLALLGGHAQAKSMGVQRVLACCSVQLCALV